SRCVIEGRGDERNRAGRRRGRTGRPGGERILRGHWARRATVDHGICGEVSRNCRAYSTGISRAAARWELFEEWERGAISSARRKRRPARRLPIDPRGWPRRNGDGLRSRADFNETARGAQGAAVCRTGKREFAPALSERSAGRGGA